MFAGKNLELKKFMGALLAGKLFDSWQLKEAKAETFFELSVNGRLRKEFSEELGGEKREFALWGEIRELFYSAIKGKRLPGLLFLVLAADDERKSKVLRECGKEQEEAGAALYLNIRYTAEGCMLTAGVSHVGFTMDKSLDMAWDQEIERFLKENDIISTHLT